MRGLSPFHARWTMNIYFRSLFDSYLIYVYNHYKIRLRLYAYFIGNIRVSLNYQIAILRDSYKERCLFPGCSAQGLPHSPASQRDRLRLVHSKAAHGKKRPRFTTDGSLPKEEREGTGTVKDLGEEGGAQYELGLFA